MNNPKRKHEAPQEAPEQKPLIVINKPSLAGCRNYAGKRMIALFLWFAFMWWLCGYGYALLSWQ